MKTKHSLEENLERIADALEKLASFEITQVGSVAHGAAAAAPAATEEAAPPKPKRTRSSKGGKAAAPAPAPEPEAPAEEEGKTPATTHDDVRESMRMFRKKHPKEDAVKILADLGSNSITALPKNMLAEAKRRFDQEEI